MIFSAAIHKVTPVARKICAAKIFFEEVAYMKKMAVLFLTAIVILLSSCGNLLNQDEKNSLIALSLPYGSSSGNSSRNADAGDAISYTFRITFEKLNGSHTVEEYGKSGDQIELEVNPGSYTVTLEAYDMFGGLCYKGSAETEVFAEKVSYVSVVLKKAFEWENDHAKVLTTSNGLNIQIKQFPANCNHLQVWAGNKVMTIGLADKEIAAGTSALAFDFPLCVRGCRYDIELKYDCFDESTETGSWFTESISGIAGGGDIGVLNTSAVPPSVKVNLSNGRVYLSSDPTDYCNKSRLSDYSSVTLRFELRGKLKDSGQEVRGPDLNSVTYWDGSTKYETAINAFLSDDGYSEMNWDSEFMKQINRARLDVFFVCKLTAYGDQEFFGKFSSPWYDVNVSGSGGGGGGDGSTFPSGKLNQYYHVGDETDFIELLTNANDGDELTLGKDIWIKNRIQITKNITINGNGKYGIVLACSEQSSFANITFKNGKGASTLEDTANFGMIFWCGSGMITFTGCTFEDNQSTGDPGGGAISLFGNSYDPEKGVHITGCTFTNNSGHAGSIDIGGSDYVDINNCNFSGSSNVNGFADRDIYCGSSDENVSISGSGNNSDLGTPYRCHDDFRPWDFF